MRLTFVITEDNKTITIPISKGENAGVTFEVTWVFGTTTTYNTDAPGYDPSHKYATAGTHEVTLNVTDGDVKHFGESNWTGVQYLTGIYVDNSTLSTWDLGTKGLLTHMDYLFQNAVKLTSVPNVIPESVTSLKGLFQHNYVEDKSTITAIVPMQVFEWDLKNITTLENAFNYVKMQDVFTGGLVSWDTSSLTSLKSAFAGTVWDENADGRSYNGGFLDKLNVSNVTDMSYIFFESNVNANLSLWDMRKVQNMEGAFKSTTKFTDNLNQDIGTAESGPITPSTKQISPYRNGLALWDLSACTNLKYMFSGSNYSGKVTSWAVQEGAELVEFAKDSKFEKEYSTLNPFQTLNDTPLFSDFNIKIPELDNDYDTTTGLRTGDFALAIYNQGNISRNATTIDVKDFINNDTISPPITFGEPQWGKYYFTSISYRDGDDVEKNELYFTQMRDYVTYVLTLDQNKEKENAGRTDTVFLQDLTKEGQQDAAKRFSSTLVEIYDLAAKDRFRQVFYDNAAIACFAEGYGDGNSKSVIDYIQVTCKVKGTNTDATDYNDIVFDRDANDWNFFLQSMEDATIEPKKWIIPELKKITDKAGWMNDNKYTSLSFAKEDTEKPIAKSDDHPMGNLLFAAYNQDSPGLIYTTSLEGNSVSYPQGFLSLNVPMGNWNTSLFDSKRRLCDVSDLQTFFETVPFPSYKEWKTSFATGVPKIDIDFQFFQSMTVEKAQPLYEKGQEEINYTWTIWQSILNGGLSSIGLLQGSRWIYAESGYINMPPSGAPTKKTISYLEFLSEPNEDNELIVNHVNVEEDDARLADPAVYLVTYYVPREAVMTDVADLTTKLDAFYDAESEAAAFRLEAGNPFFWDTSELTSLGTGLQNRTTAYQPDVRNFNVGKMTKLDGVFSGSTTFNGVLSTWESVLPGVLRGSSTLKNITSMIETFKGAESFNQNISNWNMSGVTDVTSMFQGAEKFNNGKIDGVLDSQSNEIANWDMSGCKDFKNMFFGAKNFDRIIVNWIVKAYPQGTTSKYVFPNGEEVNVGDDPDFGPNVRQMVYNTRLYNVESDPFGQGFYKIAEGASDSNGDLDGTPRYSLFGLAICFNKKTKILCLKENKEVYVAVEELKKGDLVKTLNDGYKPIQSMTSGTYTLGRPIDMGMYKMKQEGSMMADLEMTGLHSILVDEKDHQEEIDNQLKNTCNRKIYCDNKFRLNVKYSNKFKKMSTQPYTIYTFSLEGPKNQYGIWANGVLVESTSEEVLRNQIMREHK